MTRDERQDLCVARYIKTGGRGTLEAVTAFGKTRVGLRLIKYLRRSHPLRSVIVIVPRENLQKQWQERLKDAGLEANTQVIIINTAVKLTLECDFLILDEIHGYAADTFVEVFNQISYRFILGLTGTLERADKKHKILQSICPVFDRITMDEARRNGWVSDFLEINYGVTLGPSDLIKYAAMEEKYNKSMDFFQWDFGLMADCARTPRPVVIPGPGLPVYEDPAAVRYARKLGWKGNSAYTAHSILKSGKKRGIWGTDYTHSFHPEKVNIIAINGLRMMTKIKSFINNHTSKIEAALEILERFPRKTITFAESTAVADELTKRLNAILPFPLAKSYHSCLPSITVGGTKLNKKDTREYILESFRLNDYTCLNTAKAVDEGADFPSVDQGIRLAGSSTPRQQTQRRGRVIRFVVGKFALFWNIYLKDTKEVAWLKKAQGYSEDILWVEELEEVVKFLSDADERETDSGVL